MVILLTILYAISNLQMSPQEVLLENCVKEYHNLNGQEEEEAFILRYNNKNENYQAYVVALQLKKAEYTALPWKKLSIFNKGKKRLNALIAKHPNNIHLRYIRLFIQEHVPSILGYNDCIKEDKTFIQQLLDSNQNNYLHHYISKHTSL